MLNLQSLTLFIIPFISQQTHPYLGYLLFHFNPILTIKSRTKKSKRKSTFFSNNFRTLNTEEQKLSTYIRAFCAITMVLSTYEFNFNGSKLPTLFIDPNPILVLFTRKDSLLPGQNKVQLILSQSHGWCYSLIRLCETSTITNKLAS